MARQEDYQRRRKMHRAAIVLLVLALTAGICPKAFAVVEVSTGNTPVGDPGWPKGAAVIVNNPARIELSVGPGPEQYTARFYGDANVFNEVLADLAKVDVKTKRLVVHYGIGHDRLQDAEIDWVFTVLVPAEWARPGLGHTDARDPDKCPPPQIDVYTGGNVRWSDVTVPEGIEVIDERLEAHGFTKADGIVLQGKVVDLATNQPLAARMSLELKEENPVERIDEQAKGWGRYIYKGGTPYTYTLAAEAAADAQGRWVLKNTPKGWYRMVVAADGYVPRWVGDQAFGAEPGCYAYNYGLSRPGSVSGHVVDETGKPLAGVEVQLPGGVTSVVDGHYGSLNDYLYISKGDDRHFGSLNDYASKTDADGRFHLDQVPAGSATIQVRKSGHYFPGGKLSITTPTEDVALKMMTAATVHVTVDFAVTRAPQRYWVKIEPEGKAAVGAWHGMSPFDAGTYQARFQDIPPGRYVLQAVPMNSISADQSSKPLAIELKGGETAEITLRAK